MPSNLESPACPICGKHAQAPFLPFCSRRCTDIDLGRWLKGGYAIPGRPEEEARDSPGAPSDSDEISDK